MTRARTDTPRPAPNPYLSPVQVRRVFSWSRFMIVLVLLLTQFLTLVGLLWVNRTTSEKALQTQVDTALNLLVRLTAEHTQAHLEAAANVVELNRALNGGRITSGTQTTPRAVALNGVLNAIPQADGAIYARQDGYFVFTSRQNAGGRAGQRFLRIIEPAPTRTVTDGQIDASGRISAQRQVTSPYDPTTRPWFKLAQAHPGQTVWTPPYVFASSQLPGMTVASTIGSGNSAGVMAVDVQLSGLARLLQEVQVSTNGRAFIADTDGHAIAASRAWPGKVQGRLPRLNDIADPPLQAILAEQPLSTQQAHSLTFQVQGERYAAVLRSVQVAPGMTWLVGVYAPQSDFTQTLSALSRHQLWSVILLTLFSSLLAWPLAFQVTRPLASLQHQATTDALTGLANRASFLGVLHDDLRRVTYQPHELGVVIIDLDGFKAVNDTLGHATGDEVLHAVAARLLSAVRAEDTLGRLGGDEFALVLKGDTRERVQLRMESIIHELTHRPIQVETSEFTLGATAGLAFYDRRHPRSSAELLAAADKALMYGKRQAKGRVWIEGEKNKTIFTE